MCEAVKHRKCSGYIDCQQVRLIDQNLFSSKLKATHFEITMTTVDEVNIHKTKVPDKFIFHSVLLDRSTAEFNE